MATASAPDWPALFELARDTARRLADRRAPVDRRLALGPVALNLRFLSSGLDRHLAPAFMSAPEARTDDGV
ncbi:MAG: hypothetical protein KIT16_05860, partial [Rhodospirillaceae bacterium]|nr:hypothetical protein [Rhodospirillaceae bacterium]